jgi:hypothetical protein
VFKTLVEYLDVSTFPEYKKWNIKDGKLER